MVKKLLINLCFLLLHNKDLSNVVSIVTISKTFHHDCLSMKHFRT